MKAIDYCTYAEVLAEEMAHFAALAEREIVGYGEAPWIGARNARAGINSELVGAFRFYARDSEMGPVDRARACALLDAAGAIKDSVIPELVRQEEARLAGPPKDLSAVKAIAERGELPR